MLAIQLGYLDLELIQVFFLAHQKDRAHFIRNRDPIEYHLDQIFVSLTIPSEFLSGSGSILRDSVVKFTQLFLWSNFQS